MTLKQIEIAGFKSFGKATTLEFPTNITAIVGPNGSGKSNIAEALRWVLGEQSMKSLRGKRGEDLIFHGSGSASQLGKALVRVTFDNSGKIFPLDFEEVVISREVYRDGTNEYKLNGSLVRLKDIIELLSHVGIGGTGHHIISQGEADRILYANSKERRGMIEDALGLRIYQIKRAEAERKLDRTEENMKQVEALRHEIQPHMKFLKTQAGKVEASAIIRGELAKILGEYLVREDYTIQSEIQKISGEEEPIRKKEKTLEKEIEGLRKETFSQDAGGEKKEAEKIEEIQKKLSTLEAHRRELERNQGKIEGQLTFIENQTQSKKLASVPAAHVESSMKDILSTVEKVLSAESFQEAKKYVQDLKHIAKSFLASLSSSETTTHTNEEKDKLHGELKDSKGSVAKLENERKELLKEREEYEREYYKSRKSFIEEGRIIREKEDELYKTKEALQVRALDRERLTFRTEELERDREEARHSVGDEGARKKGDSLLSGTERETMRKNIQRLKIKFEEAGGIDTSVLKEYEEVVSRDTFLVGELEDLRASEVSLHHLMKDLEQHLENDFFDGVTKINKEFSKLFNIMFGGGKAELKIIRPKKKKAKTLGGSTSEYMEVEPPTIEDEEEQEAGIEITVDLPRKRIKNLDMLSGGERALTSIALLFAMTSVNPPPFLVLDEMDAALDEANSGRYGKMLQDLSQKAQLITITHNRETMKEAGVLYGITMGADGISHLLSIKFDEAEAMSGKGHE